MSTKNNSGRPHRVAGEIKRVLSDFFLRDCYFADGINTSLICITDVAVSPCLQHVKIYVVSLSRDIKNEDCVEFLERHIPSLRHYIGSKIRLKLVPSLVFFVDHSFDHASRIESLLRNDKSKYVHGLG
jgi:ribosome-binding factor A